MKPTKTMKEVRRESLILCRLRTCRSTTKSSNRKHQAARKKGRSLSQGVKKGTGLDQRIFLGGCGSTKTPN